MKNTNKKKFKLSVEEEKETKREVKTNGKWKYEKFFKKMKKKEGPKEKYAERKEWRIGKKNTKEKLDQ